MARPKLPKKRQNQRPPISKRQTQLLEGAMAGGFAFVIGSVFLISSLQNFFMATNQFASVVSSVLVDLANTDRVASNLGTLAVNPVLVAAAQAKANDMAAKGYFAHTSPDGLDSWHWFKQAGYNFQHAGENLAVDFSDSADVERAWMNSPTHRANILNGKYTEIGIATASGFYQGRPTTFVVQMFGTPAKSKKVADATPITQSPQNPNDIATATKPEPTVLGSDAQAPAPAGAQKPSGKPQPERIPATVAGAQSDTATVAINETAAQKPIGAIARQSNDWQVLATSPSTTLRYSYYLLAILVLIALAVDTGLEIKWHHRKRALVAGAMLAAMAGLFWYADFAMFRHAKVVQAEQTTGAL